MFSPASKLFGRKFPQVIATLIVTTSAISDGMTYAWTSPLIPVLQRPETPVHITDSEGVWLETLYLIACIFGMPISILTLDRFGRKSVLTCVSCISFFHWIILAFAMNTTMLFVARFISGVCAGVTFVACPMFIAEIADHHIRGMLSCSTYIMMLLGIIVIYCIGPFLSMPISSAIGAMFPVLQVVGLRFVPETPYYLLIKRRAENAKKSMEFYRCSSNVDIELNDIALELHKQSENKVKLKDLVIVKANRKACIIMIGLNFAQHFCGISVMLMNLHIILADARGILSAETAAIIFSVLMLIASILASKVMDKLGRRIIIIYSAIITGLSLILLAAYFTVKKQGRDVIVYNWAPIVAVMAYAFAFKFGMGIVPIVLTGELFASNVKALGMTLADAIYVIGATISIYLYDIMKSAYGIDAPMYLLAACCFFTAFFVFVYIPETKGKTLVEIQYILRGEKYEPINTENSVNGVNN